MTRMREDPLIPEILFRALGRTARPQESVDLAIDLAVLGGVTGPEVVQVLNNQSARLWDPGRVALTLDFSAPEVEARIPRSRTLCREFARHQGMRHLFDLNLGIGVQVLLEAGLILPGQVVVGCGRCLHLAGAVGALVLGAEPGLLAQALTTGRLPLRRPPLATVRFEGSRRPGVSAFDLGLLARQACASLSAETAVEFRGRAVEALSLDGRITLVDVAAAGFRAGLVPADAVTADFLGPVWPRSAAGAAAGARPEGGDDPVPRIDVDLDGAGPLIQGPGPGGPIRPLGHLAGRKIQSAFIGSGAAGRTSDLLEAVAQLKRAGRVHPDVRLTAAPATSAVARECLHNGVYEVLLSVGAMIGLPGASPGLAGGGALFGEGEVILSTAGYNHPMADAGRGPEIYRASPAAVAAAAVAGEICLPD